MAVTSSYLTFVLDQFAAWRGVTTKGMFGGVGLYREGAFFGLIADDVVFLKVDDDSRPEYERLGMPALRPVASKPSLISKNYYQLPDDVLADAEQLIVWAGRALAAARTGTRAKARKLQPSAAGAKPRTRRDRARK